VSAHVDLLKTEIGVIAREAGIIAGLGVGLLLLGLLLLTLLYTGTWLFLGEWLFGSMGWGILHGSLFTVAVMAPIGLALVGGRVRDWFIALLLAVVVTVLLSILFASNVLRSAALWASDQLVRSGVAVEPGILAILTGLVLGAVVLGVLMLIVGIRAGRPVALLILGLLLGAVFGAVLGFITFDTPGAIAVSIAIGLLAWTAFAVLLGMRRGLDPGRRFGKLQPRETIKAVNETRSWLGQEWQRQRSKLTSR